MNPAETLTEAARKKVVFAPRVSANTTTSNARRIPYAEQYRQFSGLAETPVERIKKAAADEQRRAAR